jgi:hypothetical protein
MSMRSAHKLKPILSAEDSLGVEGRFVEGLVVAMHSDGRAAFRDRAGENRDLRVPRSIDRHWLREAVALSPVPAIALYFESGMSPVLSLVFAAPEHDGLDDHFRVDSKTIELSASESVNIRTGKSIVTVTAAGEVSVRGKNVTTRASNLNRIRGGAIKIN